MSAPETRPGCPAWCTHHPDGPYQPHHVSDYRHFRVGEPRGRIGVALHQIGDAAITLYVANVPINARRCDGMVAEDMATLMRSLGRDDIAAAIEELAALAAGQDGPR